MATSNPQHRRDDAMDAVTGRGYGGPADAAVDDMGSTTHGAASTSSSGGSATDAIRQEGGQMVQQVSDTAQNVGQKARQQATSQVESRKGQMASMLTEVSNAVRQVGEQLHTQNKGQIASYADMAADRIDRMSGYLQNSDVDQMMGQAEQFARRRPTMFLGGAFALGWLGSRFMRSSSQQTGGMSQRGADQGMTPGYQGATPYPSATGAPPEGEMIDETPAYGTTSTQSNLEDRGGQ